MRSRRSSAADHAQQALAPATRAAGAADLEAEDPTTKDKGASDVFRRPCGRGFAVGHSAYNEASMGMETAAISALRLRDFLMRLDADHEARLGWPCARGQPRRHSQANPHGPSSTDVPM